MNKRVLLVNKFFYNRGGAEVVAINLEKELSSRGYEVGIFSMDYKNNLKIPNLFTATNVSFEKGLFEEIKFAQRVIGYGDIVQSFKNVLKEFDPQIVHLHNIHSYLSPVVAKLAKKHGCKVIWTLHDYKLLCPAYSCLNHGKVCEKCFNEKRHILFHQCMKKSFFPSVLAFIESKKWSRKKLEKYTDEFICPSSFMATQMIKGGFNCEKIKVICNFVDPVKIKELTALGSCARKGDYYAYIGRLSEEKGIETLLSVAEKLPYKLKIAGDGPLMKMLSNKYKSPNIEFLGQLNAKEIADLLIKSKALVVPSEWYENNPLSVIEALCAGTPVIGSNIGGIPELVNSDNGLIFEPGNQVELSDAIKSVLEKEYDYNKISLDSKSRFSSNVHFEKLEKSYV